MGLVCIQNSSLVVYSRHFIILDISCSTLSALSKKHQSKCQWIISIALGNGMNSSMPLNGCEIDEFLLCLLHNRNYVPRFVSVHCMYQKCLYLEFLQSTIY